MSTARQQITELNLPETEWQKNLPLMLFDQMEAFGWVCSSVYQTVRMRLDVENSMNEYRFEVSENEVKIYIPYLRDASRLVVHAEICNQIRNWHFEINGLQKQKA